MVYCETITESKSWVCPKTGVWKVICVGGGGAGLAYNTDTINEVGASGGTTSFGSIFSAAGGMSGADINKDKRICRLISTYDFESAMGINGYNGAAAYGTPSGDFIGSGYGASGGACNGDTSATRCKAVNAGLPGDVKSVIMDISEDTSIACTIGAGGTVASKGDNAVFTAFPGKSGAIIVQYLGSEM